MIVSDYMNDKRMKNNLQIPYNDITVTSAVIELQGF
jgi:hypothetical protein